MTSQWNHLSQNQQTVGGFKVYIFFKKDFVLLKTKALQVKKKNSASRGFFSGSEQLQITIRIFILEVTYLGWEALPSLFITWMGDQQEMLFWEAKHIPGNISDQGKDTKIALLCQCSQLFRIERVICINL